MLDLILDFLVPLEAVFIFLSLKSVLSEVPLPPLLKMLFVVAAWLNFGGSPRLSINDIKFLVESYLKAPAPPPCFLLLPLPLS